MLIAALSFDVRTDKRREVVSTVTAVLFMILTETVGGSLDGPLVDIDHLSLQDGDGLLLCTNGLTDVISDERITEVLTLRRAADEQCALLVDLALRAGTPDNVTVLLAQYEMRAT